MLLGSTKRVMRDQKKMQLGMASRGNNRRENRMNYKKYLSEDD